MKTADTLMELGLTLNQARIYVALLHSEKPMTAREISKTTSITRQDVYRILPALQKDGLIEKTIASPTRFNATPLKIGASILIKNKIAQHTALLEKVNMMTAESLIKQSTLDEEQEFILIPENGAVVQKISQITSRVQTSLDIITSKKRLPRAILEFFDERMQALKRGVKIRIVTEKLLPTNADLEKTLLAERKAGTMYKFTPTLPLALLLLFDRKQVLIITSATGTLETSALWSDNPSLIGLAINYFESTWNSAIEMGKSNY
jgi:sugar-specific transcriptional regulator TrmB